MPTRTATHAGSWYTDDKNQLSRELDGWLDQVPSSTKCIGTQSANGPNAEIPSTRARAIIAPHAGYSYSGRAAAWAYKALDLSNAKRIFLLGPSHHIHLPDCALSKCDEYETPLGNLKLDKSTIDELRATGQFRDMSISTDEDEHSIEMHLPYIYKMLSRSFPNPSSFPPLIPILVGSTNPTTESRYGRLLAPYLADPSSIFIISSDFCHWGTRFRYTYYQPSSSPATSLRSGQPAPSNPPIHGSIGVVDELCMDAVESGEHGRFLRTLEETGNTVCGRHPIGVVMAAVEALEEQDGGGLGEGKGRFRFVRYERSSDCVKVSDSSVSYASAFAVF
ncbi:UPF0103-domain-containing protein [Aulographum hederae CBS 113979]|uniref:UPF0103-domain-containing protein n=1 Tax=Aulographum hederae CBS 113979 TaxID=1176131 RepID=A0A6G1HAU3_9PEZI|nr:UPF0103-domain-containing protein [Aulographum hederae CBS 113979]